MDIQSVIFSMDQLSRQLYDFGIKPGGVLLVHCSFSRVMPAENGPLGLITALQEILGQEGALVMPSMTDDDDNPFDPQNTPCKGMGITADTFRQMPDVLRSDSPHSFARAAIITKPHPMGVDRQCDEARESLINPGCR